MSFECWIFSHFIWFHRNAASLWNCSPTVTAVCVIPSHLSSSYVFWVFSPHLISSHLMSSLPFSSLLSWSHLIPAFLAFSQLLSISLSSSRFMSSYLSSFDVISFSSKSICSRGVSWLFISCHNIWSLISFFLHLPFILFLKPNKTPQQLFPCRRHENFRVVVSAVSDPWVHWDTHSKPSRREAPTQKAFTQRSFYAQQAFTQRILYTQKLLHTANFYTRPAFTQKLLHTANFQTEKLLHTEAFTHCKLLRAASFYTETFTHSKLSNREAFTQKSFCTQKLLHTASFHTEKP